MTSHAGAFTPAKRNLLSAAARLIGRYWSRPKSFASWVLLALIAGCLYAQGYVGFGFNDLAGRMNQAIVDKATPVLFPMMMTYLGLAVASAVADALNFFLQQRIEIQWRVWQTQNFAERWLSDRTFYRIERDQSVDNADQRIAEDTFLFLDLTIQIGFRLIGNLVPLFVSVAVLWRLSGPLDLTSFGLDVVAHGAFWVTLGVVAVFCAAILIVSQPLVRLNAERQKREADFRFDLANIRMNAEQIALYGGAQAESRRLSRSYGRIVDNWRHIMIATVVLAIVATLYRDLVPTLNFLPGFDRYLRGEINYGQLTQITAAVIGLAMTLTLFVMELQSGEFFLWAAAIRRLDGFDQVLKRKEVSGLTFTAGDLRSGLLSTQNLSLRTPTGEALGCPDDTVFRKGERWLVRGASGAGKSTFARALAGLWPHGSGTIQFDPQTRANALFLPQKSYLPAGLLSHALAYPRPTDAYSPEQLAAVLRTVGLERLVACLDVEAVWQDRLSPGEQQRLAFGRVLLQRPDVVLLDEATSALDLDNENRLYTALTQALPDALIISIAHRESLTRHHDHFLDITRPKAA